MSAEHWGTVGNMVHLSGIRAFVAVAKYGSTIDAAAELGFTQSAISRQVADFERYVGTNLFGRRQGGMRLNAAGRDVLPAAVEILRLADSIAARPAAQGLPAGLPKAQNLRQ
ncbi:MAG: LysR family transcriptional regulator [Sinomonas sp.]|nr:LysR family transcriptional regulator [Sinomonas sp.]